jgi:S1-C subfamily serine protease
MIRRPLLTVMVALLVATPTVRADKSEGSRVYEMVLKSTVWIAIPKEAGPGRFALAMGSGSLIDKANRIILTNYHVVAEANDKEDLPVFFPKYKPGTQTLISDRDSYLEDLKAGKHLKGKVIYKNSKHDLALIKLNSTPALPSKVEQLPLAKAEPGPGDDVYSIGTPGAAGGAMFVFTPGHVRQVSHIKIQTAGKDGSGGFTLECMVIQTDSPTNPGDSGGPLCNGKGELVGVTQGFNPEGRGISIFVDLSEVKNAIKAQNGKVIPKYGRTEGGKEEVTSASKEEGDPKDTKDTEPKTAAKPPVDDAKAKEDNKAKVEATATRILTLAKRLQNSGDSDGAKEKFQEIIDKYPDTKAAKEAKDLLKKK